MFSENAPVVIYVVIYIIIFEYYFTKNENLHTDTQYEFWVVC